MVVDLKLLEMFEMAKKERINQKFVTHGYNRILLDSGWYSDTGQWLEKVSLFEVTVPDFAPGCNLRV